MTTPLQLSRVIATLRVQAKDKLKHDSCAKQAIEVVERFSVCFALQPHADVV